jgi:hypothetical protein
MGWLFGGSHWENYSELVFILFGIERRAGFEERRMGAYEENRRDEASQ